MIIPDTAPKISNDKKSLNSRHILPPSFLFRRKEAKENQLRLSFFSPLLSLSPTCNTKRTVHIRTVRFSLPNRTCGKTSFLRKTSSPAVSFVSFLQEKKTYPPSFLFRRKEAKENQLRLSFFSPLLSLSPTCNTKRTVHIRTVRFSFRAGYAGKRFPPKESLPRSVFCFFSSRKENVPPSRKEIVPPKNAVLPAENAFQQRRRLGRVRDKGRRRGRVG